MDDFDKIKEQYEQGLKTFGEGMILTDKENNLIFLNTEAQNILKVSENEVKGKNWTDVTDTFEYKQGEAEIHTDARPSTNAVLVGMSSIRTCYLQLKTNHIEMPRFLVTIAATPILLNGEVAGGIIVLKKL